MNKQHGYCQNAAKRVFLTQRRVLWKVYCPFKVERRKTLVAQTGIFWRCPDFCWDLAMRVPEETYVSKECEGKFKMKKVAVCSWGQEGMACPKVFAPHVKVVYLKYCAYLVYQKVLSLCYIITQRCHSGCFLGKQTSFETPQSISLLWLFPFRPKHPNFSTNYSYYKSPSGPAQTAVLGGMLKQNWKHSQYQRIYN